jgi:chromosome partitioning protein
MQPVKIAVVSIKGGAGKTTAAVHLAQAIHERGQGVTLVDADPQATALDWCRASGVPFEVLAYARPGIEAEVRRRDLRGHLVIDTPPGHIDITQGALEAADLALIPVQPTGPDLSQMAETRKIVEQAGIPFAVVLSRVVARTVASRATRELIDQAGLTVLGTVIPQSQTLALAYGQPLQAGIFADILTELEHLA